MKKGIFLGKVKKKNDLALKKQKMKF